jgi:prenyl protein peptidase
MGVVVRRARERLFRASLSCSLLPLPGLSLSYGRMKLSPVHVHSLSLFFAISYVGSVYILPAARLSLGTAGARRRDDPGVIRARILAVSCSTILSCVIVGLAVKSVTPGASQRHGTSSLCSYTAFAPGVSCPAALAQTLDLLGLYSIRAPLLSYMVTPMLYLGPLYALFLEGALPGQTGWTYAGSARPLFASWVAIRNYWMVSVVIVSLLLRTMRSSCSHLRRDRSRKRSSSEHAY